MPGSTPNRSYPFPVAADPNNVPSDVQALATAVDSDVDAHLHAADPHPQYEDSTEADARIAAHVAAGHPTVPVHDDRRHRFVGVKAVKTALQTINAGVDAVVVTFGGEQYDTDGIHSVSSNTGRLKVPVGFGGYWAIAFSLAPVGATGLTAAYLYHRDASGAPIGDIGPSFRAAGGPTLHYDETIHLLEGETVELLANNDTGSGIQLRGDPGCWLAGEFRGT